MHGHTFILLLLYCFHDKQFVGVLTVLLRLAEAWLTRRWNSIKQKPARRQFASKECFSLIAALELWVGNFLIKLVFSFKKRKT